MTAKILKSSTGEKNVSSGLKQMSDDPWLGVGLRYPRGTHLFGKISSLVDDGLFVEIEPGVEGLVHISKIDSANKNVAPFTLASVGEEFEVVVLDTDEEKRRISLGMV